MIELKLGENTNLKFTDISSEQYRTYHYPDGGLFRIDNPQWLSVTPSSTGGHSHRIVDDKGISYYIAPKWIAIQWQAKENQPHFIM